MNWKFNTNYELTGAKVTNEKWHQTEALVPVDCEK